MEKISIPITKKDMYLYLFRLSAVGSALLGVPTYQAHTQVAEIESRIISAEEHVHALYEYADLQPALDPNARAYRKSKQLRDHVIKHMRKEMQVAKYQATKDEEPTYSRAWNSMVSLDMIEALSTGLAAISFSISITKRRTNSQQKEQTRREFPSLNPPPMSVVFLGTHGLDHEGKLIPPNHQPQSSTSYIQALLNRLGINRTPVPKIFSRGLKDINIDPDKY